MGVPFGVELVVVPSGIACKEVFLRMYLFGVAYHDVSPGYLPSELVHDCDYLGL